MRALAAAALLLVAAACGGDGDGGDEDAFCERLDELSARVAAGADRDELLDVIDEVIEVAPAGDELDAVRDAGDDIAGGDEPAAELRAELGDFADGCGIDEFAADATTTTTSTTEATTTTTEATTTTTPTGGAVAVGPRQPVPAVPEAFAAQAQACFDGDMAACDNLYASTDVGSVEEAYGDSCGGRIEDGQGFDLECTDVIGGPDPVPPDFDPAFVDQANACFDGDMAACDALFDSTDVGTEEERYGDLCGGRVPETDAYCVEIFGETAFE